MDNKVGVLNTNITIDELVAQNPRYTYSAEDDLLHGPGACWAFVFSDDDGKIRLTTERHVPEDMLFDLLSKYGGEFYASEYDAKPDRIFLTQAEIDKNIKSKVDELLNGSEQRFAYMMLDRMRSDCEYYLGYGNRYAKHLWAGDERLHIAYMKEIWNRFPKTEKPEWLSYAKILDYEKEMVSPYIDHPFFLEITIDVAGAGSPIEVSLSGYDAAALNTEILPLVHQLCARAGYVSGNVSVDVTFTRDGEFLNHDEDVFSLDELNAKFSGKESSVDSLIDNAKGRVVDVLFTGTAKEMDV